MSEEKLRQGPTGPQDGGERAAFEEFFRNRITGNRGDHRFGRSRLTDIYLDDEVRDMWSGWRHRAVLANRPLAADDADPMDELRRSVAEILGQDPDTWPIHGNAPLAIASALALATIRAQGDGGES